MILRWIGASTALGAMCLTATSPSPPLQDLREQVRQNDPPFSWEPEIVEVLDSGTLALTSGPVRDPDGNTAGIFNTIWRLEGNGDWKAVFDKGCAAPTAVPEEQSCHQCG